LVRAGPVRGRVPSTIFFKWNDYNERSNNNDSPPNGYFFDFAIATAPDRTVSFIP
jgi:hypothetical protein